MAGALIAAAIYLLVHLALYFAVLRNTAVFTREIVIFGYHAVSVVAVTCLSFFALIAGGLDIATLVAILAAHAIYSMSFLELWSLAQGGYSLAIMRYTRRLGRLTTADLRMAEHLGNRKRTQRMGALLGLRLVHRQADDYELTRVGAIMANLLQAVVTAANIKTTGLGQ